MIKLRLLQVSVFSGGMAHLCPASSHATWWVLDGERRREDPEMVVNCDLHSPAKATGSL